MATLKELLAAKQLEANNDTAKLLTRKVASLEDADQELTEAIDRIDPPKKPQPTSLVLSKSADPEPQPPLPESWQEGRALGATKGELIPMVPVDATLDTQLWHRSMAALETDLCIMQEPSSPESCWLALRSSNPDFAPLLLHRLPWLLYPAKPTNGQPF